MHFSFPVQFQLLALVLEGTLAPKAMLQLILKMRNLCVLHEPDAVAHSVRMLQYHVLTPGPDVEAHEMSLNSIIATVEENIRYNEVCTNGLFCFMSRCEVSISKL